MTESTIIPIRNVCIGACGYACSSILACKNQTQNLITCSQLETVLGFIQ